MFNPESAKRLESDPDGAALLAHIQENIDALDTTSGIDFTNKEAAAIEGRARQLAAEKLIEILEPFGLESESTVDKKTLTAAKTGVV